MLRRVGSVLVLFIFSCASGSSPLNDYVSGIIITRRDSGGGGISVLINGKVAGRVPPLGRWGLKLRNGRYLLSFEHRGMRSPQFDCYIQGNRVEYDVWAYENTEPTARRANAP